MMHQLAVLDSFLLDSSSKCSLTSTTAGPDTPVARTPMGLKSF